MLIEPCSDESSRFNRISGKSSLQIRIIHFDCCLHDHPKSSGSDYSTHVTLSSCITNKESDDETDNSCHNKPHFYNFIHHESSNLFHNNNT